MPGPVVPDRVHTHAGIEYAAVLGYRPLLLDLYLPGPGASPGQAWPVVLFLHGGGWGLGSRTEVGSCPPKRTVFVAGSSGVNVVPAGFVASRSIVPGSAFGML